MNDHITQLSNLEKAEMLKNVVTNCAVGGERENSRDYAVIRLLFLGDQKLSEKLPRFIKTCRNLPEIWSFIKPKFAHYHERREFIREEFDQLLAMLETEARSPSDVSISETVQKMSSVYIQEVWKKALERRATDPHQKEQSPQPEHCSNPSANTYWKQFQCHMTTTPISQSFTP